ncbi:MAG: SOS response-associated peptidase family protein [Cyanobacteria bacterium P01_F01_bin.33]
MLNSRHTFDKSCASDCTSAYDTCPAAIIRQGGEEGDRPVFAMAELWERWQGGDSSKLETRTILTTAANATMKPIHARILVILAPENYVTWLRTDERDVGELGTLLHPIDDEWVSAYPVSTTVNNPRNDSRPVRCE